MLERLDSEIPPFAPERIEARVNTLFGGNPGAIEFDANGRAQVGLLQVERTLGGNVFASGDWTEAPDAQTLRATLNGIVVAEYVRYPTQQISFYILFGADNVRRSIYARLSKSFQDESVHTEVEIMHSNFTYSSSDGIEDESQPGMLVPQNQTLIAGYLGLL